MGTLSTLVTRCRYKAGDVDEIRFTDAAVLSIVNGILDEIYRTLVNVESNLVSSHGTITTADGTAEYDAPATNDGYQIDGMWLDGEDSYLVQVSESDKVALDYEDETDDGEPIYYYINESGKVGFIPTPDDEYTVHASYSVPQSALTNIDTDDVPTWARFFKGFLEYELSAQLELIMERDPSYYVAKAREEKNKAMRMVYNYGNRRHMAVSDFTTSEGI